MQTTQIASKITARFGDAITQSVPEGKHPRVHCLAKDWRALAEFLYNDPELAFDWLGCLTAVDYIANNQLAVVYDFYSTRHKHWFAVKVFTERDTPHIHTVMDLWPAADWHEREAFDMTGILFDGHTDLRRILLPEDWAGYPLRKDYVFPREYHGIPGTYETDWQQKSDYPK